MRQIREALRLHLQAELSYNEVACALKLSKSVVGKYMSLARVAGVDWAVAQTLSDEELEARLYRPALPRSSHQLAPDFAHIHQELKRPGVTLMLLWEEYARGNEQAYKYTSFCVKYRLFAQSLKRSMRQSHVAGEKLFVDYAGQTVPVIDPATGEISPAQIFVATLGASNYTYACATARQTTADWIGAQIRALEFLGGVPNPRLLCFMGSMVSGNQAGAKHAFGRFMQTFLRPLQKNALAAIWASILGLVVKLGWVHGNRHSGSPSGLLSRLILAACPQGSRRTKVRRQNTTCHRLVGSPSLGGQRQVHVHRQS